MPTLPNYFIISKSMNSVSEPAAQINGGGQGGPNEVRCTRSWGDFDTSNIISLVRHALYGRCVISIGSS